MLFLQISIVPERGRIRIRRATSDTEVQCIGIFKRTFSGKNIHLLLTELEGCTVSYGPNFLSLSVYGPTAKRLRAINRWGKTGIRNEVSIYYISTVCLTGSETITDAPRKQNESI